ncbi:MAG: putative capsular polysaccharide synthesis family protein [Caulobacteraceae bacterium]
MSAGGLIVVHQMAKVGSMAWVEAARATGTAAVHSHFLTAPNLAAIEAILAAPPETNTIAHPLVAREVVRKGARGLAAIEAARRENQAIGVVTGMRDPVARSLSLLNFFADFCGHTGGGLSARDGAGAEAVGAALGGLWEAVLTGREPTGSFERLVWRMIGTYRTWFDEELAGVFGIDVFSAPFPAGGGAQRMGAGGVEVLAYRAEDMTAGSPAGPALVDAARAFLGAPDFALPQVNTAETRRSYPLYREARDRFRLPAAALDQIYAAPAVRHFYTAEEIAGFKKRWGGDGRSCS